VAVPVTHTLPDFNTLTRRLNLEQCSNGTEQHGIQVASTSSSQSGSMDEGGETVIEPAVPHAWAAVAQPQSNPSPAKQQQRQQQSEAGTSNVAAVKADEGGSSVRQAPHRAQRGSVSHIKLRAGVASKLPSSAQGAATAARQVAQVALEAAEQQLLRQQQQGAAVRSPPVVNRILGTAQRIAKRLKYKLWDASHQGPQEVLLLLTRHDVCRSRSPTLLVTGIRAYTRAVTCTETRYVVVLTCIGCFSAFRMNGHGRCVMM
jgi:hypothetical protein